MTQPQQKASGKQQQEEEDEEERDDEDEEEQQEEEEPEDKEQEVALKQAAKPRAAGKAAEGAAKRRRHAAAMAAVAAAIGELDSSDEGKQEEQMELEGEEEREQEEEQEQTGQSKSQPGRTERGGGKTAGVEKATVPRYEVGCVTPLCRPVTCVDGLRLYNCTSCCAVRGALSCLMPCPSQRQGQAGRGTWSRPPCCGGVSVLPFKDWPALLSLDLVRRRYLEPLCTEHSW